VEAEKMENIAMLLKGGDRSAGEVGLKLNAPERSWRTSSASCRREKSPTVSRLADTGWVGDRGHP